MNLLNTIKPNILEELKQGNKEVLKGLPPSVAMSYGLALQREFGQVQDSPIDEAAVNEAMLNRLTDTGIKERVLKQIEDSKATGE